MYRIQKTIFSSLHRDRAWAYQEIMTEAMFVLFLGCHLSLKFGTRIFPEWQDTRVDPDHPSGLDEILQVFPGYKMNGCKWDDIVSPWLPLSTTPVFNATVSSTSHSALGFIGTVAVLGITAVLAVSFLLSLLVNVFWTSAPWTGHLSYCRRVTTAVGFNPNYRTMDSLEHCVNPDMPWRPYIAFLIMYLGVPWVWLVGCVLPLVAVAGMMLAVISSVVGVQAIFPCVVVGVFAIGIHCVGRIWGVWTTETYWTRMSRFRRKLCGSTSSVMDKLPKLSESQKPTLRVSNGMEPLPYMILFVRKAWMFLFECTVLTGFTYLLLSRFPQTARALHALTAPEAGNWSYWTYKNCTKCCYNYATGMGDITAMLSYWIDLGYPRWNTDSATLLDLFNSTFSPAVNRLFLAWTGSILVTVSLPYILIGIFVLCAVCHMLVGGCTSMFTGWSSTATNVSKSEPPRGQWKVSKDMQLCKDQRKTPGDFCVCALWADIQRLLLSALSRMCFWLFTVLPLVECFCPERYQLVVVLLLLSCYTVWLYGVLIHFLYRSHRSWLKCSRT